LLTRKLGLGEVIYKEYDANDNLIEEKEPRPGDKKLYCYDKANRLIQIKHETEEKNWITQYTYDVFGNKINAQDSFGNITHYSYDEFHRLIETIHPCIQTSKNQTKIPVSKVSYDINGHPTSFIDKEGWETTYAYNARGKPISKHYPDGRIERYEYYPDGTLAKTTSPNGNETTYRRDCLGRVLEEKTWDGEREIIHSYQYKGLYLISQTDGEGITTHYSYDGAGRLISEKRNDEQKLFSYDSLSRREKIIQSFGGLPHEITVQTLRYDLLNRVTEERLEDHEGNCLQCISYSYDELGNITQTRQLSDTSERVSKTSYDGKNRPILIIDAKGNKTHFIYREDHRNALGQHVLQIGITDPLGRITKKIYNALGYLEEIIRFDPLEYKVLSKQEILHDCIGRPTQSIHAVIIDGFIQREYTTKWNYYFNEEEELILEGVGSDFPKKTQWRYNHLGQKEELIKPSGDSIKHEYDSLGRLKRLYSSDIDYEYTYDRCHRVSQVEDKIHHTLTKRQYNDNRLDEETLGNCS
jgi:YD repeat-containing protein